MKVVVDFDRCDSNGICVQTCPEVFSMDDQGYLYVADDKVAGVSKELLESCVKKCPTEAISLDES
jgi:ferredoxin